MALADLPAGLLQAALSSEALEKEAPSSAPRLLLLPALLRLPQPLTQPLAHLPGPETAVQTWE